MKRAPDSELRAKNEDERGSVARERGVCFMLGPLTFDRIQPELLYKGVVRRKTLSQRDNEDWGMTGERARTGGFGLCYFHRHFPDIDRFDSMLSTPRHPLK